MYGFTDDLMSGVQRWRSPGQLLSQAATIPTEPIGVIVGIAAPLIALLLLLGGGGGGRRR